MVRADIIDFIDKVLRTYSHNLREPFGGKQLLLVGDVFQLEPVVKVTNGDLNRFYPNPYFFSAKVFQEMELVSIELTKVYRQTDQVFVSVLDHIRTNTAGNADLQLLNTRYTPTPPCPEENDFVHHAGHPEGQRRLYQRKETQRTARRTGHIKGEIHGEFPESSLPTLMELVIKPGAQVIFIKNDQENAG